MNDDLLTEILLRLPAKSLIRFKSVCKKWRSLISSDYFCHRHTLRRPKPHPSSLILQAQHQSRNFFYFDGEKTIIPFNTGESFGVPDHPGQTRIMQACNGLLLLETKLYEENEKPCDRACCYPTPEKLLLTGFRHLVSANTCSPPHGLDISITYFVYNPTTRQSREISLAHKHEYPCVVAVFLAFDPSESPFYKVVCIRASVGHDQLDGSFFFTFHIEIYDSESRSWKVSLEALTLPPTVSFFNSGVHWNNSIYWCSDCGEYFCFDIAKNEIKMLEFPRTPDFGQGVKEYRVHRSYLQESNGHLYHFEWSQIYNDRREFGSESVAVWELRGGDDDHRFEWLFKSHHVVGDPRWIIGNPVRLVVGSDGDEDEACTLLTTTRSRRMRAYHFLHNKTYHEDLYDFYPDSVSGFQFGECLALV